MGQRIALSCKDCGLHKEISVGSGLMSNNPDVIASCLVKEDAEKWKTLFEQKKISSFTAEQKAYYCAHCSDVFSLLTVEAELSDGSKIVLGNKCKNCNRELYEIILQKHRPCPVCKGGKFGWQQIGFWD